MPTNFNIATLMSRVIVLLIAFTVHELAHAWIADLLGDDTPRRNGRLTLNPLSHLDVIGSLMLIVAGFGWAKPVPINPSALLKRNPNGVLYVALAGPVSNMLLALVGAVPFQLNLISVSGPGGRIIPTPSQFLLEFVFLNIILAVFNLIPIFPLDGEKVLTYLLPPPMRGTMDRVRPFGPLILIALIFLAPSLGIDFLQLFVGLPARYLFQLLV